MLTLSYGYKKPQTNDKGASLFAALEFDIQRLNDHSHDGINSGQLTSTAISTTLDTVLAANWVAFGPTGHYRQQVTMPPGINYDDSTISARLPTGEYIYPTIEKVSATQFYIYSIDNSIDIDVVYGI